MLLREMKITHIFTFSRYLTFTLSSTFLFNIDYITALKLDIGLCGLGKHQTEDEITCLKPKTVANFRQDAGYYDENFALVNDGVGGWEQLGVDSRFYSANLTELLSMNRKFCEPVRKIRKRWNRAYDVMKSRMIEGSTTVLEANYCLKTRILTVATLGDAKLVIFRKNLSKVSMSRDSTSQKMSSDSNSSSKSQNSNFGYSKVYSSIPQAYSFNFPYQLSSRDDEIFRGGVSATVIDQIKLKKGDIIVMGSDGIWDNLYEKTVLNRISKNHLEIISEIYSENSLNTSKNFAKHLVKQARLYSNLRHICSPFCEKCVKAGYLRSRCLGGKLDDSTVAVIFVK